MSHNEIVISLQRFKKSYKNVPMLTGVDFQIKTDSIFALLGSKNPRQVADDLLKRTTPHLTCPDLSGRDLNLIVNFRF